MALPPEIQEALQKDYGIERIYIYQHAFEKGIHLDLAVSRQSIQNILKAKHPLASVKELEMKTD